MPVVLRVILIYLAVAAMAGGIAMLGNQLGRKIGRRKMTVMGMRPRHTSIFITTVTGIVIALFTLTLAVIFSENARIAILGVESELELVRKQTTEMRKQLDKLTEDVLRGKIIWNFGERIALNTIPAGSDERVVRNIIGSLLKQANNLSITQNNKVANAQEEPLLPLDTLVVKYEADELRQWLKQYTNLEKPVGLWIVVKENCLFGDPVPITVESFPVEVIFSRGEVIFQKEVHSQEILYDWLAFIEELKAVVLRKGMIELNGSLGADIDGQSIKTISRQINFMAGKVSLRVVANRDLYQSSNLDVSIEVKPIGE